uniref:Uncharacterized protein n=1 Tax=Oryza nivara TaxID=4536 RepID=A0A0E0J3F1_ORYNI
MKSIRRLQSIRNLATPSVPFRIAQIASPFPTRLARRRSRSPSAACRLCISDVCRLNRNRRRSGLPLGLRINHHCCGRRRRSGLPPSSQYRTSRSTSAGASPMTA